MACHGLSRQVFRNLLSTVLTPRRVVARQSFATMSTDTDKYRLPTNVRPTHYDLTIRTDLEDLSFDAVVKIKCTS